MDGTAPRRGEDRTRAGRSDGQPLRIGLAVSILVHAALLVFVAFPRPDAAIGSGDEWQLRQVEVPPAVEIPPAPEAIRRPSPPEIASVQVAEPVSAGSPAVEPPPATATPEPPRVTAASMENRPAVAPPEVAPALEARDHFRRRLELSYPRMLRDRGIGGVVRLQFFVDDRGDVSRVEITESSGHGSLDRLARRLVGEMTFLPALNRDRAVGVWVSQRICFATVEPGREAPDLAECERLVTLR